MLIVSSILPSRIWCCYHWDESPRPPPQIQLMDAFPGFELTDLSRIDGSVNTLRSECTAVIADAENSANDVGHFVDAI